MNERSRWNGATEIAMRISVSQEAALRNSRSFAHLFLVNMTIAKDYSESRWFAVRVRSHHETVLAVHLTNCCHQTFLPLYRTRRVWSDRVREIDTPLFPHYVFCRFPFRERVPVLRVPGVYEILSLAIPDEEIAGLQTAAASGRSCRPWPYLKSGNHVTIERGPLRNLVGIVVEEKGRWRLVLSVQMLQRSVAVEVDREDVAPLKRP
jgi:transcription antitermination factor NusG